MYLCFSTILKVKAQQSTNLACSISNQGKGSNFGHFFCCCLNIISWITVVGLAMEDDPKLKVVHPKKYKKINDCCTFAAVGQNGQYCNYQGQNNVKIRVSVRCSVHTKN